MVIGRRFGLQHTSPWARVNVLTRGRLLAMAPAGSPAAPFPAPGCPLTGITARSTLSVRHRVHVARHLAHDTARIARFSIGIVNAAYIGIFSVGQHLLPDLLRVLGSDHPDTLTTRANLAYWLGAAGQPGQAASQYRDLLVDRLRVLGPDHPGTLAARENLARWLGVAGQPDQAAAQYRDLLTDRLRVLGPDHPDTLTTRANLAYWLGVAGQPGLAAEQYRDLLPDYLRVVGPDHPGTLAARANVALWLGVAGQPGLAAEQYRDLLPDFLRVLGPDHPHRPQPARLLAGQAGWRRLSWRRAASHRPGVAVRFWERGGSGEALRAAAKHGHCYPD